MRRLRSIKGFFMSSARWYVSILFLLFGSFCPAIISAPSWIIQPEQINIEVDGDRTLQLLDVNLQELPGAKWAIDDPEKAELVEDEARIVVHAKIAGKVVITASLNGEMQRREITIWPHLPEGTTRWSSRPIGRHIKDVPAVPGNGPHMFSLQQRPDGITYLRGLREDGIQSWVWRMPEVNQDVELICGDWFSGAEISSKHRDHYTVYVVGHDGKLRWQHTIPGLRKGLAISTDHSFYLLTQSLDSTSAILEAFDEKSGAKKFELSVPQSRETLSGVKQLKDKFICSPENSETRLRPISLSSVYFNMDGLGYLAFSKSQRTISAKQCTAGATVAKTELTLEHSESVRLWKIQREGTYRDTIVEEFKGKQKASEPLTTPTPTGALVTDNTNGMLVPLKLTYGSGPAQSSADELVYRVDPEGQVVFKSPMPRYSGPLHDGMVIGENDVAFATRGSFLIAFDLQTGKELWRWDAKTDDIEVFAALANGHCMVQTPKALMEVADANNATVYVEGKVTMDWQGNMFVNRE
jgi:outer membrane protein assembly factor BamB